MTSSLYPDIGELSINTIDSCSSSKEPILDKSLINLYLQYNPRAEIEDNIKASKFIELIDKAVSIKTNGNRYSRFLKFYFEYHKVKFNYNTGFPDFDDEYVKKVRIEILISYLIELKTNDIPFVKKNFPISFQKSVDSTGDARNWKKFDIAFENTTHLVEIHEDDPEHVDNPNDRLKQTIAVLNKHSVSYFHENEFNEDKPGYFTAFFDNLYNSLMFKYVMDNENITKFVFTKVREYVQSDVDNMLVNYKIVHGKAKDPNDKDELERFLLSPDDGLIEKLFNLKYLTGFNSTNDYSIRLDDLYEVLKVKDNDDIKLKIKKHIIKSGYFNIIENNIFISHEIMLKLIDDMKLLEIEEKQDKNVYLRYTQKAYEHVLTIFRSIKNGVKISKTDLANYDNYIVNKHRKIIKKEAIDNINKKNLSVFYQKLKSSKVIVQKFYPKSKFIADYHDSLIVNRGLVEDETIILLNMAIPNRSLLRDDPDNKFALYYTGSAKDMVDDEIFVKCFKEIGASESQLVEFMKYFRDKDGNLVRICTFSSVLEIINSCDDHEEVIVEPESTIIDSDEA